jgi:DNA-binding beta-propeller fold protein YncE
VAIWDGKIYVADSNRGVFFFDLVKKKFDQLPGAHGLGQLNQPINIRIAPDGIKYVADPVRGQVVVFDKNDLYVNAFGNPGTWKPVDAVPYGDDLFVADMKNFEIVVLNRKDGKQVRRFGLGEDLAQKVSRPTNLVFDREGRLFVSDIGVFKVLKFDRDGHFLGAVGEMGRESGTFSRPKGIAIDREQRLYVVDAAFSNVQLFNKDGNVLFAFGVTGKRPGDLDLPAQVIVDYDNIKYFQQYVDPKFDVENLVIVANQFGDKMINVYAMGKERGKHYPTDVELLEQLKERLKKAEKEKPAEKKGEPVKEGR